MSTTSATSAQNRLFVDEMRRRARRQVLGAFALLFLAITVLPVLFEKRSGNRPPAPQVKWESSAKANQDPSLASSTEEVVATETIKKEDSDQSSSNKSNADFKPQDLVKETKEGSPTKKAERVAQLAAATLVASNLAKGETQATQKITDSTSPIALSKKKKNNTSKLQQTLQDDELTTNITSTKPSSAPDTITTDLSTIKAAKLAQLKKKHILEMLEKRKKLREEARLLKKKQFLHEREIALQESHAARYNKVEDSIQELGLSDNTPSSTSHLMTHATKTRVSKLPSNQDQASLDNLTSPSNITAAHATKKRFIEAESKEPRYRATQGADEQRLVSSPLPAASSYTVQIASLSSEEKASAVKAKLRSMGLGAYTQRISSKNGTTVYRVRVGPYHRREAAASAVHLLRGQGYGATLTAAHSKPLNP